MVDSVLQSLPQRRTWTLTKGDFLPRVCREQEYQQSQGRDEHTGDEQVETIVERPAAHGYCVGDIWVWLFAALIELLIPLARDSCVGAGKRRQVTRRHNCLLLLSVYDTGAQP